MILEEPLQKYLEKAITTDPIYTCEMSFYRELTQEELEYMRNEVRKANGRIIVCYHCGTCAENTDGERPYHIDRIRF